MGFWYFFRPTLEVRVLKVPKKSGIDQKYLNLQHLDVETIYLETLSLVKPMFKP